MPCNENPGENTAQERWKNKKELHSYDCNSSVGSDGFEPPKLEAADLQSAPFGHSGNYPVGGR